MLSSSAPSGFPVDVVEDGKHPHDERLVVARLHRHLVQLLAADHVRRSELPQITRGTSA